MAKVESKGFKVTLTDDEWESIKEFVNFHGALLEEVGSFDDDEAMEQPEYRLWDWADDVVIAVNALLDEMKEDN